MRELPRQLSVDELAELFEGRTRLVELLAKLEDPLGQARRVAARDLTPGERLEVLDAHPAIGAKKLSARSAAEQGATTIWTRAPGPLSCSLAADSVSARAPSVGSTTWSGGRPPRDSPRSIDPREATIRTPSSRAAWISASSSPSTPGGNR